MPASPHEVEPAVAEGVRRYPGWGPLHIDDDGEVTLHFCERTRDDDGRFNPEFDDTRLLELDADHVILATGQGADLAILDGSGVENIRGFIVADPKTLMTRVPGVFAGGDAQHGPRRPWRRSAPARSPRLPSTPGWTGQSMDSAASQPVRHAEVIPLQVVAHDRTHLSRAAMPERRVEEVLGEGNYVQIEEGLTDTMANDEARRCLRCDLCIGCGLCMAACSEMGVDALRMAGTTAGRLAYFDFIGRRAVHRLRRLYTGLPDGAIQSRIGTASGARSSQEPSFANSRFLVCSDCGAPTQTPAHRELSDAACRITWRPPGP